MSLKDMLKKNLTPEMFTSVVDALGDDFDFDMVPRTRLNKVIAQRNELRTQVAGKPNTKGASAEDDDDDDDDESGAQEGTMTVKQFKKLMREQKNAHDKEIATLKKQNVVLDKLRAKNAIDPTTILNAGLLDLDKFELSDDGTLKGIDEAIETLVTDKSYFFNSAGDGDGAGDNHQKGTGKDGGDDKGNDSALDAKLAEIFGPEPSNNNA